MATLLASLATGGVEKQATRVVCMLNLTTDQKGSAARGKSPQTTLPGRWLGSKPTGRWSLVRVKEGRVCIVEREGVRWREAAVGRRQKESTALSGLGGDATVLGRQIGEPPSEF